MQIGELHNPRDQGGKLPGLGTRQRLGRLVGREGGEFGQHFGVQGVGLGQPATRPGEGVDAAGVGSAKRQALRRCDVHQGALIAARRLADDARAVRPPSEEGGGERASLVGYTLLAARSVGDVDPRLRHIDAHKAGLDWGRVVRGALRRKGLSGDALAIRLAARTGGRSALG